MVDPNPIVASKGVDKLRGAGIDVTVGVEQELCKRLNEAYIHKMLTGNPFLTIRYSISLNGTSDPIRVPLVGVGQSDSKVIIFVDKKSSVETSQRGNETVVLDRINLNAILEYCKQQGLCSLLLDLRGTPAGLEKLVKEGMEYKMLQKIVVEVLPVWEGEGDAAALAALKTMGRHVDLKNVQTSSSDGSIVLEGYF
ncbi:unnamed protein product [Linum trigynum]|uniref:Uncharacterized protein n=1 Tax=Linum trigynum TaxID=586398 RepID=A0AAV2D1Z0_9ROSI